MNKSINDHEFVRTIGLNTALLLSGLKPGPVKVSIVKNNKTVASVDLLLRSPYQAFKLLDLPSELTAKLSPGLYEIEAKQDAVTQKRKLKLVRGLSEEYMKNQQVLEKAITKAIDGGWHQFGFQGYPKVRISGELVEFVTDGDTFSRSFRLEQIIFNKEFAKSLWGKERLEMNTFRADEPLDYDRFNLLNWQYHLQRMAISDDPIAYLKENM